MTAEERQDMLWQGWIEEVNERKAYLKHLLDTVDADTIWEWYDKVIDLQRRGELE